MSVEVKIIPIHFTYFLEGQQILTNQTTLNVKRSAYSLQELTEDNPNFKESDVFISDTLDSDQSREDMYGNRYKEVAPSILLEWFKEQNEQEPLSNADLAIMSYLAATSDPCILFFH